MKIPPEDFGASLIWDLQENSADVFEGIKSKLSSDSIKPHEKIFAVGLLKKAIL